LAMAMSSCSSNLALHVSAIIVNSEVVLLEPFEAARCLVSRLVTYLADRSAPASFTRRACAAVTISAVAAVVTAATVARSLSSTRV
jgi:hypothetical protein